MSGSAVMVAAVPIRTGGTPAVRCVSAFSAAGPVRDYEEDALPWNCVGVKGAGCLLLPPFEELFHIRLFKTPYRL